jgi:hypothetical protein
MRKRHLIRRPRDNQASLSLGAPTSWAILAALALLLTVFNLFSPAPVSAHAKGAAPLVVAGHVTVIILDMSGSMAQSDPNGLRCSAANAYIDLSGPGDYLGVVGLTGSGSGGPQGFGSASVWAQPSEMATVANRAALRQTIANDSKNCAPQASTPTYDALNKALALLQTATQQSGLSGSAILLTDGVPEPNANQQITAIQHGLLPQFKRSNFPLDVIGLGADQSLHSFLSGLADATGGTYYSDSHGVVPGVSALNIAPFFVSIFALRNGRIAANDIPPTQLNGRTVSRNFAVGDFVSQLSVIAVKDSPNATVTLTAPNGQVVTSTTPGILYSSDPHYVIFSFPDPQQGAWQLNASGTGQFLMDSLKVSSLTLNILAPSAQAAEPLGQTLNISAQLVNGSVPITGSRYSLTGSLTYSGGVGQYSQDFTLDDRASPGTYKAQIVPPAGAPPGAYSITINAREISETIASATRTLRIERFPAPILLSPTTHQPATTSAVPATVTLWDPVLRLLYGAPIGLLQWLSQAPLSGLPAQPAAVIYGQVQLAGKPYSQATVSGSAASANFKGRVPLSVFRGDNADFTATFAANQPGTYTLTLDTQGAFQDSHGDLGVTTHMAQVTLVNATLAQEARAWAISLLYLFILAFIALLIRYWLSPHPFGRLVASDSGGGEEFARSRRSLTWLFEPSVVYSQQMGLDPGVRFRFLRGGRILARGVGAGAHDFRLGGDPLPSHEVAASESTLSTRDGELSYLISAVGGDDDEENDKPRGGLLNHRSRADEDEDDEDRPRRGLSLGRSRSRYSDDDDYGSSRGRNSRRSARYDDDDDRSSARSRSSSRDIDDDYGSSQSRKRRSSRYSDDDW